MQIALLRRRASHLGAKLAAYQDKPWDTKLAREVLAFQADFNMVRGEEMDVAHVKFWATVLAHDDLRAQMQGGAADSTSDQLLQLSHRITEYVVKNGKNGGFKLIQALCKALKETSHPSLL